MDLKPHSKESQRGKIRPKQIKLQPETLSQLLAYHSNGLFSLPGEHFHGCTILSHQWCVFHRTGDQTRNSEPPFLWQSPGKILDRLSQNKLCHHIPWHNYFASYIFKIKTQNPMNKTSNLISLRKMQSVISSRVALLPANNCRKAGGPRGGE